MLAVNFDRPVDRIFLVVDRIHGWSFVIAVFCMQNMRIRGKIIAS